MKTGSVTSRGIFPWYGEKCSSTMAVTFSSGDNDEPKIVSFSCLLPKDLTRKHL